MPEPVASSVAVSVSVAEPTKYWRWSWLPAVAAVAVGAVLSLISSSLNVVVLTADTLSLLSVARYSIV
jgi:hypothetical protein